MSALQQTAWLRYSTAPLLKPAAREPGRSWSVGENGVNVFVYLPAQSIGPPVSTFLLRVTPAPPEPPLNPRGTRTLQISGSVNWYAR